MNKTLAVILHLVTIAGLFLIVVAFILSITFVKDVCQTLTTKVEIKEPPQFYFTCVSLFVFAIMAVLLALAEIYFFLRTLKNNQTEWKTDGVAAILIIFISVTALGVGGKLGISAGIISGVCGVLWVVVALLKCIGVF